MWKNTVEPGRPQMTILRMRIKCWITKTTDTHSKYVVLIALPLQQLLQERASMLSYTYTACLVTEMEFVYCAVRTQPYITIQVYVIILDVETQDIHKTTPIGLR